MNKEIQIYQICSSAYKNNMLDEYFNQGVLDLMKLKLKEKEAINLINNFNNLISGELYLSDIKTKTLESLLNGIYNEYGNFYLKNALSSLNKYIEKHKKIKLKSIYNEFNSKIVDLFTTLETNRLILRKVQIEDSEILWNKFFCSYDDYRYYRYYKFSNYEEMNEIIKTQVNSYKDGNYFRWAITLKEDNALIGNINLHNQNIVNNNIKIGYFIFKDYRHNGYANEALNKVIEYAFNTLKIHKIIANTSAINIASNKTLLKSGFILEGINHEHARIGIKYTDSHNYYLINKENV